MRGLKVPRYDYKCNNAKCDAWAKQIEVFQKMSDDPLTKCPTCKKDKLVKLLSLPAGNKAPMVGAGDETTITNGDDGKPYRFKSGTKTGQKKELESLLNRRQEQVPEYLRKKYNVD